MHQNLAEFRGLLAYLVDLDEADADCELCAVCLRNAAEQCVHDARDDASAGAAKREGASLQRAIQHYVALWQQTACKDNNSDVPLSTWLDRLLLTIVYVFPLPVCP